MLSDYFQFIYIKIGHVVWANEQETANESAAKAHTIEKKEAEIKKKHKTLCISHNHRQSHQSCFVYAIGLMHHFCF